MSLPAVLHNWPWLLAGAVGAISGFVAYCNAPLSWKATPQKATIEWLSEAPLREIEGTRAPIIASDLWRRNGALFMAVRRPG